jgi:hypothetical protein
MWPRIAVTSSATRDRARQRNPRPATAPAGAAPAPLPDKVQPGTKIKEPSLAVALVAAVDNCAGRYLQAANSVVIPLHS